MGSLVSLRVLPPAVGNLGYFLGFLGCISALALSALAAVRHRSVTRALDGEAPIPGGGLPTVLMLVVVLLAAIALVVLITPHA